MISGHKRVCGANTGGVASLGLIDASDRGTEFAATISNKKVTAITLPASKKFKGYQFEKDTCILKHSLLKGDGSNATQGQIDFFLKKMGPETVIAAEEINDASSCGIVAVCKLNNGSKFLVGYSDFHKCERALEIETYENDSGSELTSKNGASFSLLTSGKGIVIPIDDSLDIDAMIEFPAS